MKNRKADAVNTGSQIRSRNITCSMKNHTPIRKKFQYNCSFCQRELPSGSIRFKGIGACPHCFRLAHQFVDNLRTYYANYFNNLGVRK